MTGFTYKSYNFVDKDPIIDEIRTVYEDSGVNYKWLHDNSNVSPQTLSSWFTGKTKKPQAATINAVLRALGYKLGIVPHGSPVKMLVPLEQPKSRPRSSVRHVIQMNKYKKKRKA